MFINYVSLLKQRGALTRSHCGAACVDVGPVLHQVWSALISRVDGHRGGAEHGPGTWSAAGRRAGEDEKKERIKGQNGRGVEDNGRVRAWKHNGQDRRKQIKRGGVQDKENERRKEDDMSGREEDGKRMEEKKKGKSQ